MVKIGFPSSHEPFPPGELLRLVRAAEHAGFGAAMCSDHFHPWTERQGRSGFAWAWLGAAMRRRRPPGRRPAGRPRAAEALGVTTSAVRVAAGGSRSGSPRLGTVSKWSD
jgi:hypothetical protein